MPFPVARTALAGYGLEAWWKVMWHFRLLGV